MKISYDVACRLYNITRDRFALNLSLAQQVLYEFTGKVLEPYESIIVASQAVTARENLKSAEEDYKSIKEVISMYEEAKSLDFSSEAVGLFLGSDVTQKKLDALINNLSEPSLGD